MDHQPPLTNVSGAVKILQLLLMVSDMLPSANAPCAEQYLLHVI